MKKGFTIIEVSILFVFFLIVAFLVVPLSLDDTLQAKNASRWKNVQTEFDNIFFTLNNMSKRKDFNFMDSFELMLATEIKSTTEKYKISFMNGNPVDKMYDFNNYKVTNANAVLAIKNFNNEPDKPKAMIMYDVNGKVGPNVWGKDVFGLNIYSNKFEPFCKNDTIYDQKQDCSKTGTGLCCSNYYLLGGNF